jgi:NAD(P)-dependent dehydrogenase (short-subunit alcohol dehydrogenase family)
MSDFSGKTILITGAAGGIGQSLSRLFAERGGAIAALDRNPALDEEVASLTAEGITAAAAIADIRSDTAVSEAIDQLRTRLGPIDVLINNAGFSGASNLESTDAQIWNDDLAGNLNGAYFCSARVIDDMKKNGGAIVNIGSVNGLATYGDPAYSAAKAGLISLTKSMAMEYGRFGIRANIVCPGTVRTPIWDHRVKRNPEILTELAKWYPLGRIADPIDVAKAVAFLASDEAAAITGAVLTVDCGLTAGNIVMTREVTMAEY